VKHLFAEENGKQTAASECPISQGQSTGGQCPIDHSNKIDPQNMVIVVYKRKLCVFIRTN